MKALSNSDKPWDVLAVESITQWQADVGFDRAMRCTIDLAQTPKGLEAVVLMAIKNGMKRTLSIRIDDPTPDKIADTFKAIGQQLTEHYFQHA